MIPDQLKNSLKEFIVELKKQEYVLGILVVGSYARNSYHDRSDVDIKIIFDPFTTKRIKGVKKINNYHISYSGYSTTEVYNHFYTQLRKYSKFQARMIAQGEILYDKTGEIKHIQDEAKIIMKKPFIKPHRSVLQLEAYTLWKYKDELLEGSLQEFKVKEYYIFLEKSLILYSKLLGIECIFQYPFFKMNRYINDASFRKNYGIERFPNQHFLSCLQNGLNKTGSEEIQHTVETLWCFIVEEIHLDFENFEISSERF